MKIYKYQISPYLNITKISLPLNAKVLHVAEQHDKLCLWAEVDEMQPKEERKFLAVCTGTEFSHIEGMFLGTVLMDGGSYVVHVYEIL